MTISITLIICLLVLHWFGDFFLQTEKQATLKSKSNRWLSYHVGTYTLVLLIGTLHPLFALINGVIHWGIDYVTSRQTSRLWAKQDYHDFFVVVGLDQLLHCLTLILTAHYLFT